jgi:hypothetical protein
MSNIDEKIRLGMPIKNHRQLRESARYLENKIVELYWSQRDRNCDVSNGDAKQNLNKAIEQISEFIKEYEVL